MSDLDAAAVKKLKVAELRSELTKRGLDAKGNKPVLVERLLEAIESESAEPEADEDIKNSDVGEERKEDITEEAGSPDVPQQDDEVADESMVEKTTEEVPNEDGAVESSDQAESKKMEEQADASPEAAVVDTTDVKTEEKPEPMETNEEPASVDKVVAEKSEEQKKEGEDTTAAEASRVEPEEEEVELDDSLVVLDKYNCDLHLKISPEGLACEPIPDEGFSYVFAGARATWGVTSGKVCFECKVSALISVDLPESEEPKQAVRLGWSTDACNLMLGEDELSFGFDSTGKKCNKSEFTEFGQTFGEGDVITCYLDLDSETKTVSFSKNGEDQGMAYELPAEVADKALFPHILVKNAKCSLNFGSSDQPSFPIKEEHIFIQETSEESRVHGTRGPSDKKDCEVIMMIGLPASGKTTWVKAHVEKNPEKKYNVLGTYSLLDKMKIMGVARRRDAVGYNKLMDKVAKCLHRLFELAPKKKRNYILDQTNVYSSAQKKKLRPFEGFSKRAVVCIPTPEDMKKRNDERRRNGTELPDNAIGDMKANFTVPKEEDFSSIEYADQGADAARKIVEDYVREGRSYRNRSSIEPSYKRPRYDDRPRYGNYGPRDRPYDDRRSGYDNRRGSYGGRPHYGGRGFRGGFRGGRGGSGGYHDRRDYGGYRGGSSYGGGGGYRQSNYQPRHHQSNYNQQRSYQQHSSHSYGQQSHYSGSSGYSGSYNQSSYYQPQQHSYGQQGYGQQSYGQQGYTQSYANQGYGQANQQNQSSYGRYSSSGYSGSSY